MYLTMNNMLSGGVSIMKRVRCVSPVGFLGNLFILFLNKSSWGWSTPSDYR